MASIFLDISQWRGKDSIWSNLKLKWRKLDSPHICGQENNSMVLHLWPAKHHLIKMCVCNILLDNKHYPQTEHVRDIDICKLSAFLIMSIAGIYQFIILKWQDFQQHTHFTQVYVRAGFLNLGYTYPQGYVRGILGVRDRFLKILQFWITANLFVKNGLHVLG